MYSHETAIKQLIEHDTNELDDTIAELENWHKVRSRLNANPERKSLKMDTLPRAIVQLKKYRTSL